MQTPAADPLAQLLPIITPTDDISIWPLAPGWWALLCLLLILIAVLILNRQRILNALRLRRLKKETISKFQELYSNVQSKNGLQHYLQQSNLLLKQFLSSQHNTAATTYSGSKWVTFLQQHDKNIPATQISELFSTSLYQKEFDPDTTRVDEVHQWLCEWVKNFQPNNTPSTIEASP